MIGFNLFVEQLLNLLFDLLLFYDLFRISFTSFILNMLEISKIGTSQLIGYGPDISFFKRYTTLAPSVTGSAFLSIQTDICPQVVGKTN